MKNIRCLTGRWINKLNDLQVYYESKYNCNFPLNILNRVADRCSSNVLCHPSLDAYVRSYFYHFENITSANEIKMAALSIVETSIREQLERFRFLGSEGGKDTDSRLRMRRKYDENVCRLNRYMKFINGVSILVDVLHSERYHTTNRTDANAEVE